MKIIISPYSTTLRMNGKPHPKNYPHWEKLVALLKANNHSIIQIGIKGEGELVEDCRFDLPMPKLVELIKNEMDIFISVDNFFPHFCHHYYKKHNKHGIVIFSRSNPKIFGYRENTNLLKSGKYLRNDQFLFWDQCEYVEDAFVSPEEVMKHIAITKTIA